MDLGFEASPTELFSFDKGIDPNTGKALWGAVLGPFHFTKRQDFSEELVGLIHLRDIFQGFPGQCYDSTITR